MSRDSATCSSTRSTPDFYTGNCHKWMCSPKGTAFLYARPEVQKLIEPLIVGHGWLPDRRSERPLVDYVERFGTRDMAGFLAVPAAIAYMEANDWQQVRKRCHRMARDAKRTVERELQTASLCPESFAWFSQLCPIRLPDDTDVGALSEMLRDRYRIEMPLLAWQGIKLARLSVQVYTQQGEVDAAVAALLRHVPECRPGDARGHTGQTTLVKGRSPAPERRQGDRFEAGPAPVQHILSAIHPHDTRARRARSRFSPPRPLSGFPRRPKRIVARRPCP